jgi:hypothetical protein
MTTLREGLPLRPAYMAKLPLDHRGFPVPWFVPKIDGEWNFQVIRPERVEQAVRQNRCWICGGKLHKNLAFVVGAMCVVNRTTSEPPSHCECAEFAVRACPFLVRPKMRRAPHGEILKESTPGILLERNPGVAVLWVTRKFLPRPSNGGLLFTIQEPTVRISCWAEGRPATYEEIEHSFSTGLPALEDMARQDDAYNQNTSATTELVRRVGDARKLLQLRPKEALAHETVDR